MAKRHVMTPARKAALRKAQLASAKKRRRKVAGRVVGAAGLVVTAGYLNGRYGGGRKRRAKVMPHKPGRGPAGHGPSAFRPKQVQLALPEGKTTKSNRNRPKPYRGKDPLRAMFHPSNRYIMPGQVKVKNLNNSRSLPQSRYPQKPISTWVPSKNGKRGSGHWVTRSKLKVIAVSGDYKGTATLKNRPRVSFDASRRKQYKGMSNSQKRLRRIGTIKGSM